MAQERLPPTEKLPLALRKNIRDEWEAKRPEFEKQISEVLGTEWTIDINPNQIHAYAKEGYAKESTGSCIASYIDGAVSQLKYFETRQGEEGIKELNEIASAHVLTMDVDTSAKPVSYCGRQIVDGKLTIIFNANAIGTNSYDALELNGLLAALNAAPNSEKNGLSFAARTAIREDYTPKIGEVQDKINRLLGKEGAMKLEPRFEDAYEKLKAESQVKKTELRDDWERSLGSYVFSYFESVASRLEYEKFEDDDMMQEGFLEAVENGVVAFRIVDKLKYGSYCEVVIEDGVLFVQTTTKTWGSNAYYAAEKLVDQL